jgi:hypothetical protein
MENYESAAEKFRNELIGGLDDVKQEFLAHFNRDLEYFIDSTAQAFLGWQKLDTGSGGDKNKSLVSGLVFSSITLLITSMRLFLTGYIVAAGNIQRQVLESIALALLCSCKSLNVLERFYNCRYSASNAVRDALRHSDKINTNKSSLAVLSSARDFYHVYSHPSMMTLASHMRFSDEGLAIYVGSSFDKGKLDQYRKEMAGRVNLAKVMSNFVSGVQANVNKW